MPFFPSPRMWVTSSSRGDRRLSPVHHGEGRPVHLPDLLVGGVEGLVLGGADEGIADPHLPLVAVAHRPEHDLVGAMLLVLLEDHILPRLAQGADELEKAGLVGEGLAHP